MQTTKISTIQNIFLNIFPVILTLIVFVLSFGKVIAQTRPSTDSTMRANDTVRSLKDTMRRTNDTAAGRFNQILQTVTVQGAKPYIQHKAGKIVLNVAESPVAAGGNAADVISHVPGVNGMQWHGKTLLVLIDGRQTGMRGGDLQQILAGMPASTIDRVELIGSPSAKYDAQGGAVINIITVHAKKAGLNGVVTSGLGYGQYGKFNEGITMNYKSGSWNLYGGYDIQYGKPGYTFHSQRSVDSVQALAEETRGERRAINQSLRLGFDQDISKRSSWGVLARGMFNLGKSSAFNRATLSDALSGADSISTVQTRGNTSTFVPSVNAWYKHKLDSTGKELIVNADYLHYSNQWKENFETGYYDFKGNSYRQPSELRDWSPADNQIMALSADYTQPVKGGKLEMGVKSSFTRTDNDIRWEQNEGAGWAVDAGKTNHFIYRENINAAYLSYSRTWKQLNIEAGLRGEQTNTEGHSLTMDQVNRNSYWNLFRNLGLQYNLREDQQLGFSWRQSIERFGFDVVNPFVRYISQYNYSQGNPYIKPSVSDNLGLSYSWKDELSLNVSYGWYKDALGTVYRKADSGDAVISGETNMGNAIQFETDLSYYKSFFGGKWVTSNSVSLMYARYSSDSLQAGAQWTAMVNVDNIITLGKGWKAELSGIYYSPFLLGVFRYQSRWSMDLGISKTMLKEKGKLTLNVSDIFNTMINNYSIQSYGVSSSNSRKPETRVARLVFTYRFGGKAARNNAGKRTGIDDLRGRLGN